MPRPRAPWWMYLLAASFLVHIVLLNYNQFWGPETLGALAPFVHRGMVLEKVLPDSAAERAGLKAGDRLIAVDGQHVGNQPDWFAICSNLEVGRPIRLQLERDARPLTLTLTLQRISFKHWTREDWIVVLTVRGSQLVMLILALFIAFSRPYDLIAHVGAGFLAGLSVGGPEPPYGVASLLRQLPALLSGLLWIPALSSFLATPLFFTFAAVFPQKLIRARWGWFLAWGPTLLLVPWFLYFSYLMLYEPQRTSGAVPDWLLPVVAWTVLSYVAGGVAALVMNYRRLEDANERRRVRVLVAGFAVGWLPGIPFLLSAYVFPESRLLRAYLSSTLSDFANFLGLAFPLSLTYAILRHRLFDIRVMIRQGLQYALARRLVVSLVPTLAVILVADLLAHGDQPLASILLARGWVYVALGGLALTAHMQQKLWLEALDRRFFRERYDAQRLLREVVEEVREAQTFDRVAPRVVARIEAALHPEFAALLKREPGEPNYRPATAAPAGHAPPPFAADSKLVALLRVLNKPMEISLNETSWLKQQLPHEETDFLRSARIDLVIPVATVSDRTEVLLVLGIKRSEEPYSREDQDLIVAIASSLALLLDKPALPPVPGRSGEALEECPTCGACYDTGVGRCSREGAPLVPIRVPRLLADRYRLERRLGRGGMGTVYEATDTSLDRRVALKLIREDLLSSAEAAERFRREARAAAAFSHPNVVTVHDFGVAPEARAFLVMELLTGVTLSDELRRKTRLAASRALEILRGVCAAVEAAHRRQLLHRDLKPENIFLARDAEGEVPKVLDFGLAKFLRTDTQATTDTDPAALVGTFYYMGPEQLRGQPPDVSWDLWALAVIAYEMLTGEKPFSATTSAQWHAAVLAGRFTPVSVHLPEAPDACQEFFARSFSLDPNLRPASASALFSSFQRAL